MDRTIVGYDFLEARRDILLSNYFIKHHWGRGGGGGSVELRNWDTSMKARSLLPGEICNIRNSRGKSV